MLSAVISSVLSYPALQLALQPVHQWYVHPGPLVLGATPLNSSTRMEDRDRTVSRRSEPSSRTTLIGEQPNPWDLLQPQDVMSRHRGAKHPRRYGLLEGISLLSPAYLLSVERWPFHSEPPDHYDRLSTLLDLSVSQSGRLMPLIKTSVWLEPVPLMNIEACCPFGPDWVMFTSVKVFNTSIKSTAPLSRISFLVMIFKFINQLK